MPPVPAAPDPGHRASDADRDAVSELIRDAAAEGRIGMDELDDRLSAIWSARTYGELAVVTADLPVHLPAAVPAAVSLHKEVATDRTAVRAGGTADTGNAIAIFGGSEHKGRWSVPATMNAVAIFGGIDLDLREATLTSADTTINVFAMFGGIEITVGEDVDLRVSGAGILGGFQGSNYSPAVPGAPIVRIKGAAIFGGIEVKRRPRRKSLTGSQSHGELGDGEPGSGRRSLDRG